MLHEAAKAVFGEAIHVGDPGTHEPKSRPPRSPDFSLSVGPLKTSEVWLFSAPSPAQADPPPLQVHLLDSNPDNISQI